MHIYNELFLNMITLLMYKLYLDMTSSYQYLLSWQLFYNNIFSNNFPK